MSKYPSCLICLLVGGPIIRIATNQGVVAFEWHDYCGPMPVSLKRGHVGDERRLPEKHDFWRKVTLWVRGGRIVKDGWAVVPSRSDIPSPEGT